MQLEPRIGLHLYPTWQGLGSPDAASQGALSCQELAYLTSCFWALRPVCSLAIKSL